MRISHASLRSGGWLGLFDQRSAQPELPNRVRVETRVTASGATIAVIIL